MIAYSPVAALNRTYAVSKVKGNAEAVREAEKLQLEDYPYYHVLLGELYREINPHKARQYFQKALSLAKRDSDKNSIATRLSDLRDLT